MDSEEFQKFLSEVAVWSLGSDAEDARDPELPDQGAYVVVSKIKPCARACEYCDQICMLPKKIKYSSSQQSWVVKCQDCGDKHIINVGIKKKYK